MDLYSIDTDPAEDIIPADTGLTLDRESHYLVQAVKCLGVTTVDSHAATIEVGVSFGPKKVLNDRARSSRQQSSEVRHFIFCNDCR